MKILSHLESLVEKLVSSLVRTFETNFVKLNSIKSSTIHDPEADVVQDTGILVVNVVMKQSRAMPPVYKISPKKR